jgi:hypothetical protein
MIVLTPELLTAIALLLSGLAALVWSLRRKP